MMRLPELLRWKDLYIRIAEQLTLNDHDLQREAEEVDKENDGTSGLDDAFSSLSLSCSPR